MRPVERINNDSITCLNQIVNVYQSSGQFLLPGQYEFPFSFKLPSQIPGTFHQVERNLNVSISYTIEAFLEPFDKATPKLKYKSRFIVREPIRGPIQTVSKSTETKVVCYGCYKSHGSTVINAIFEKNAFCPGEEARAIIHVDNTNCSVGISGVSLELKQSITVRAGSKTEYRNATVVSRSIPGLAPKENSEARQTSIVLPQSPDSNIIFLKGDGHLRNAPIYSGQTISSTTTRNLSRASPLKQVLPPLLVAQQLPLLVSLVILYIQIIGFQLSKHHQTGLHKLWMLLLSLLTLHLRISLSLVLM